MVISSPQTLLDRLASEGRLGVQIHFSFTRPKHQAPWSLPLRGCQTEEVKSKRIEAPALFRLQEKTTKGRKFEMKSENLP